MSAAHRAGRLAFASAEARLARARASLHAPLTGPRRDDLIAAIEAASDDLADARTMLARAEIEAEPVPGALPGHAADQRTAAILRGHA
jgi:hypothetical protein